MGTLGTLLRTPQGSPIVGRLSLAGAPLFVCLGGHIFSAFLSVFQSGHIFGGGPTSPVFGGPSVLSVCHHGRLLGVERVETRCTAARMLVSGSRALLDPSGLSILPTVMSSLVSQGSL